MSNITRKQRAITLLKVACLSTAALAAGTVNAADPIEDTWYLDASSVGLSWGGKSSSLGTPFTFSSDNENSQMRASGWYAKNTGEDLKNADYALRHWNGISMDRDEGGPDTHPYDEDSWGCSNGYTYCQHTMDNYAAFEFILFEFEEKISLHNFRYGFTNKYSNTSVFYYDEDLATQKGTSVDNVQFGSRASSAITSGTELKFNSSSDSLTQRGFKLLDGSSGSGTAFVNPGTSTTSTAVAENKAPTPVFSYLWGIGADFFRTQNIKDYHNFDGGKLASIKGVWHDEVTTTGEPMPAPATIALLGLGGLLLRRRMIKVA